MRSRPTDPTVRDRLPPRVLVVDDEPVLGGMIRRILERWGYVVEAVESGAEALRQIRSFAPELVLVDLQLLDMNGRDLVRQVHIDLGDAAPVMIALTDEHLAEVEGTVAVCHKPFGVTDLVELVRAHTRRTRCGTVVAHRG